MIKKYRIKRGYTQEQLAELINISWRQLQRLENNTCLPTLPTFAKLVDILKIDEKDVMSFLTKIQKKEDSN